MKKVIVGYDARGEADDALVLGRSLAQPDGAELHVAVVLPRGRVPFEEAVAGGHLSDQLDEGLFESAETTLGSAEFERASLDGALGGRSAARALYEYAADQDADLIVVGSSHRGKLGRIFPGSVGESLLRGAPCAVAVAPRGFAAGKPKGFGLVGIGYDGSEEAVSALRHAERLSRSLEAKLRLITVVPTDPAFQLQAALAEELVEDLRVEFRGVLERGLSELEGDTDVEAVLREGDPATVLSQEGAALDLLVLGSRGYGPTRGALIGAVSAAVVRSAPCPVLVLPRGSGSSADARRAGKAGVGARTG